MANVIAIVGDSGTGKSTSIESLNPKETFIINCLGKPLPFKGSGNLYNSKEKNLAITTKSSEILEYMNQVDKNGTHIKNLVIDDSGFVMTDLYFAKASESGYNKFTEIAKSYQGILAKAKTMRSDLNIVLILHEEDETSNSIKVKRKVKTIGKLLDDQYSPLSTVSVALFTNVSYDKEGNAMYQFVTNRTHINGIEIPAKSPRGMFETLFIPNDLSLVFKTTAQYYS